MKIEISAPGKLILFGEYAVLFGAPALVMAVNRRSRVELSPSDGVRWRFFAPGLASEPAEVEFDAAGGHRWYGDVDVVAEFGLVDRLLRELAAMELIDIKGASAAEVVLDTTEFYTTRCGRRCKLGLGSSAALTVALVSALAAWSGAARAGAEEIEWLQSLVDAHRAVQGGKGSGIDVAASAIGGVVSYRLHDDGTIASAAPTILPENLMIACIWTGRPASTGDFLAKLEIERRHRPQPVERALARLGEISERGAVALAMNDSTRFLETIDEFWHALDSLGKSIEMPILSEDHHRLRRIVEEFGMHYKPSGAGGGDFGLAISDDRTSVEELSRRVAAKGFEVVDLPIDHDGVKED